MNRDMMIEKYLSGRMDRAQEEQFLHRLTVDRELRRRLDTERAIRRTLLKDRDALPREDPAVRNHVMAMLGVMAPAAEQAASIASSAAAATSTGAATQGASLLASGIVKGIVMALAGAVVTVAMVFVTRTPETHPLPTQRSVPARSTGISTTAQVPEPLPVEMKTRETVGEILSEKKSPVTPLPASTRHTAKQVRVSTKSLPAVPAVRQRADSIAPPRQSSTPSVVVADSMQVRVTIDLGKLKR